jgi:peptide/nickel transport system substrate-binding protein
MEEIVMGVVGRQKQPQSIGEDRSPGLSRRDLLQRGALLGAGVLAAPLLAACGGGSTVGLTATSASASTQPAATSGSGSGSTSGTGGTSATPETSASASPSGAQASGQPKKGGTLKWYLPDDPPDLDPQMQTTSSLQWVLGMCYNGLLRYNVGPGNGPESEAAATPVPDLALKYENVDELTYVFHLRQGVKFHDGTDLTAEDVAFSLNRIRTDSPEFQRAYAFAPVDSVEATTPDSVTIKLKEPYAALINEIAAAYTRIAPKHVIDEKGDMKQVIVGTGPFKLKSYQRGQQMVLERNDDYFEPDIPYLDSIEIAIMPDNSSQLAAFNSHAIDIYQPANSSQLDTMKKVNPDIVVTEYAPMGLNGIGCNTQVKPFDDVRVRQALWYAIDQQKIIDIVYAGHGSKQRAVPATYAGWVVPYDQLPMSDAPNIDKAKALLKEAGYENGFKVKCKSVYRYSQKEATVAAQLFKAIGVDMEIVDMEYGAFLTARNNGDFDLIAFALAPFGDISDFTAALYGTQASRNYGHWGDADLDALLEKGDKELDVDKRKAIYADIQKMLAEKCWVIDFPEDKLFDAVHPYVKGFVSAQNPERGLGFWHVWLDK